MAKYKPYSYDQVTLLPVSFKDQIHPGTFEYTLSYIIDHKIDLTIFEHKYSNDDEGRPAIHPGLLLKGVLYAYAKGIIGSRRIQEACRTNVVFMALTANTKPHFTTIAAFISGMKDEIHAIFRDVVLLCMELDLVGGTLFALDGCKLPSNASKEMSGTHAQLTAKKEKLEGILADLLQRHQEADARPDSEGETERRERSIARLEKKLTKMREWLSTTKPKAGKRGKEIQSNITDNESAKMKSSRGVIQGYNGQSMVDGKRQVVVAAEAFGDGRDGDCLEPLLDAANRNLATPGDPEPLKSKQVTADTGYYNEANLKHLEEAEIDGYVPDPDFRRRNPRFTGGKERRRSAARFSKEDFRYDAERNQYLCPAGKELHYYQRYAQYGGIKGRRYFAKASDCSSCPLSSRCLRPGAQRRSLFISDGWRYTAAMKEKIDTEQGRQVYGERMRIVEPVFGNQVHNKGMNRFTLRTRVKVNIQWLLYNLVHNLEKITNFGTWSMA